MGEKLYPNKQELEEKGFKSIGFIGKTEYMAKHDKVDNVIIYFQLMNDESVGNARSITVDEIKMFNDALKILL